MNNELPELNHIDRLRPLLSPQRPVCALRWQGRPAFGKRSSSLRGHERFLLALAPLIRRRLGRDFPFAARRYDPALPIEVQRLLALHAAGQAVPEVLAAAADLFVTADAGATLAAILDEEPDPSRRHALLAEAARDLARFHQAGHWHGAAQVRNLVRMPDGRLGRIDFETSLDRHFPLPLLQAFDAALFFTSIVRSRDLDALPMVAKTYLDAAPPTATEGLRRGLPLLRRLAASRLLRRLVPKEVERMRAVASLPLD